MDSENQKDSYTQYRQLHARPWIRLWARSIDLLILGLVVSIIMAYLTPTLFIEFKIVHSLLVLFLWFLIEPFVLSTWGTTVGKYLLNISVLDLNGCKPTLNNAFSRSFWVWCAGYGFGVPIVSLFTLYFSYQRLNNSGTTRWDKNNFIVTHGKIGFINTTLSILIVAATMAVTVWLIHLDQPIPLTHLNHSLVIPSK